MPEVRAKLQRISRATMDRLLKEHKRPVEVRVRSRTKPTTGLMNEIPIRTFTESQHEVPVARELI